MSRTSGERITLSLACVNANEISDWGNSIMNWYARPNELAL